MMPYLLVLALAQASAPGAYQMNAAEVQACGAMAVERNERSGEIARRDAAIEGRSAELTRQQREIEATRRETSSSNNERIDAFNKKIKAINALRSQLQPEIDARDRYVAQSNALIARFNANCVNRQFDPKALAALPVEQREALSGKATTRTVKLPAKAR